MFQKRKASASDHPAQSSRIMPHHCEMKKACHRLNSAYICPILSRINMVFDRLSGTILFYFFQHFLQMLKLKIGFKHTYIYYICTTI